MNSINLAQTILTYLRGNFDLRFAIEALLETKNVELYLTGSSIRRALHNSNQYTDCDIIASQYEEPIKNFILTHSLQTRKNSYGDIRCHWNEMQIDFMFAKTAKISESNIIDTLQTFDINLNAIAFNLRSMKFIDPFNAIQDIQTKTIRLNKPAWKTATDDLLLNQYVRLVTILHNEKLILPGSEKAFLSTFLPKLLDLSPENYLKRAPQGKDMFLQTAQKVIALAQEQE